MKIEAKYEIGTHIWVVYDHDKEACVYDTHIEEIAIDKDGLTYFTTECIELSEQEIVLYDDEKTLIKRIKEIMKSN